MIRATLATPTRISVPTAVRRTLAMDKKAKTPKKPKSAKPKGAKTA
jgi:hypothetical protein